MVTVTRTGCRNNGASHRNALQLRGTIRFIAKWLRMTMRRGCAQLLLQRTLALRTCHEQVMRDPSYVTRRPPKCHIRKIIHSTPALLKRTPRNLQYDSPRFPQLAVNPQFVHQQCGQYLDLAIRRAAFPTRTYRVGTTCRASHLATSTSSMCQFLQFVV